VGSGQLRLWLIVLLALAVGLAGCPTSDDDDSTSLDDDDLSDDDDSALPSTITAVSFAASVEGVAAEWDGDGAVTDLTGTFHLLYWSDLEQQALHCRQRVAVEAQVRFGDASSMACDDCSGRITVTSAWLMPPEDFEDSCTELPPEIDLSFLVASTDVTIPADFRQLQLAPAAQLLSDQTQIGHAGLSAADVLDRYQTAGLEVLHVAFVDPAGWLATQAELGGVAVAWQGGLLPMFVVYADGGTIGSPDMEGDCYLATLWTVHVGEGIEADAAR